MDPQEALDHVVGETSTGDDETAAARAGGNGGEDDSVARRRFDALMTEYARATAASDRKFDQIIRIAGIAFSASGALLFLVADDKLELNEWSFWLLPLLLTLLYTFVIFLTYDMVFTGYYTRDLEDRIAELSDVDIFHYTNAYARGMTSFRTGYPPMLAVTVLFVLFAAGIYLTLVTVSFFQLRAENVPTWQLATYIVLQTVLTTTLLWSAIGIWKSLWSKYDQYIHSSAAETRASAGTPQSMAAWATLGYALLPRTFDFAYKSLFTIGALVTTAFVLGIPFSTRLATYGFWTIVCVELLAKQATYIWNEILDAEADKGHPHKSERFLSRFGSTSIGKALFLTRAAGALALAALLYVEFDFWWLPLLVAFIFVWQYVYDRWAKRSPRRRLAISSIGYAERSVAGSLAAMEAANRYDALLIGLLSLWIVVSMVMVLAEYWWAELTDRWTKVYGADRLDEAKTKFWFLRRHPTVQHWANGILIVAGLAFAYLYPRGRADRHEAASDAAHDTTTTIGDEVAGAGRWAIDQVNRLHDVNALADEMSYTEFVLIVGALSVVGVGAMTQIQPRIKPENRQRWLLVLASATLATALLAPRDLTMLVLAVGAPLILAVNFERLGYAEILAFERLLKQGPQALVAKVNHLLFHPWAARISIEPILPAAASEAMRLETNAWAGAIRQMYKSWADCLDLDPKHVGEEDGGRPNDLTIRGPFQRWRRLPTDAGDHCLELREDNGTAVGECVVRVAVMTLGVAADASTGIGIPPYAKEEAADHPVPHGPVVVRRYAASKDPNGKPGYVYQSVLDPRTNERCDSPSEPLHQIIPDFHRAAEHALKEARRRGPSD